MPFGGHLDVVGAGDDAGQADHSGNRPEQKQQADPQLQMRNDHRRDDQSQDRGPARHARPGERA